MIATAVSHYPKVGDGPGQQRLRQAIARFDRSEIDQAALDRVADEVTAEVIREQEDAGLDIVTDGQVRWQDPLTYICSRIEGFRITGLLRWFESNTYYRQPVAAAPLRWRQPILRDDLTFARERARKPVKAVLTGPYTIAALSHSRRHSSLADFVLEVARVLNEELKSLAEESPSWIQVDEPAIASNRSVRYPRDLQLFAEAMHVLVDGVDANLSLYVYHGHVADYPELLSLPFSLFGLDLVQGPENWSLIDGWRSGKQLGVGIVDARNVRLEDETELSQQLHRAREAAGDSLHVSPSCGLEFLPREQARAKLALLARAAHAEEARV